MISGRCRIRVRYSDTDAMAVGHHARHVAWFEVGRTELLRCAGYPYEKLERAGVALPIVGLEVRYRSPARYDDVLEIETHAEATTAVRVSFRYALTRPADGRLLATGRSEHAAVDAAFRPARLPAEVRKVLSGSAVYVTADGPC
jgi:acyl-CoA thioester hydrolase